MNFEKFKDKIHESWHDKLKLFIESEECDKIYEYLKKESARGKIIVPQSDNVWRCFKETPLTDVKVVICGLCPYHTMTRKGDIIADGLLMGCSNTGYLQPTLEQFYGGIERELYQGLALDRNKDPDVLHLAKQGVLMFNAALTTELNKAGAHQELWEPFVKYLFENVFQFSGIPFVFLGKDAARVRKYLTGFDWQFPISHPASASYRNGEWSTEAVFKRVNTLIKENNGYTIDWLKKIDV
jgi:uracil DNA glycosylase